MNVLQPIQSQVGKPISQEMVNYALIKWLYADC